MMKNKLDRQISIAIDISYQPACLALSFNRLFDKAIVYENSDIKNGFDLLSWISNVIKENRIEINDISEWTIGSGPGAFSQIRMLSVEIQGLTFGRNTSCRGIPSGMAFASIIPEKKCRYSVIYQYMKNLPIISNFKKDNFNCSLTDIFAGRNFENYNFDDSDIIFVCGDYDNKFLIEKKIKIVRNFPISGLLMLNPTFWERESLKELIYVRPPAIKRT
ncbi:MAG TPA: hypothetical protein P5105_01415 [Victivallales bacterium]|nr:hypothetical protein [Victivallales bacterium]